MMQSATQAAIWRYSTGARLNASFVYGGSSTLNTKFWRVYTYLVNSAYSTTPKVLVYDEQPGQAPTQAIIVVTPAAQIPTPSTPVTASPAPTQPTATPTEAPTTTAPPPTPTAAPTTTAPTTTAPTTTAPTTTAPWSPGPDGARVWTSTTYRITVASTAYTPIYAGFDTTGDGVADVTGFSIEPLAWPSTSRVTLGAYDSATRTGLKDAGRLRWVATHGLGAVSGQELAAKAGISVNLAPGSTDVKMLEAATQAAVWRFATGDVVNQYWRFGYTTADNTKFWTVYTYLVQNAVPVDTKVAVYDSKPGQPAAQGFIAMTPAR